MVTWGHPKHPYPVVFVSVEDQTKDDLFLKDHGRPTVKFLIMYKKPVKIYLLLFSTYYQTFKIHSIGALYVVVGEKWRDLLMS